jgi:hypothetical protein
LSLFIVLSPRRISKLRRINTPHEFDFHTPPPQLEKNEWQNLDRGGSKKNSNSKTQVQAANRRVRINSRREINPGKTQDPPFGNQGWGTLRVFVLLNEWRRLCSLAESKHQRFELLHCGPPACCVLCRGRSAPRIRGLRLSRPKVKTIFLYLCFGNIAHSAVDESVSSHRRVG